MEKEIFDVKVQMSFRNRMKKLAAIPFLLQPGKMVAIKGFMQSLPFCTAPMTACVANLFDYGSGVDPQFEKRRYTLLKS